MDLHTGSTSTITKDTKSSNGTAAQGQSQSTIKPFGSAAARFTIRSAKTVQYRPRRTTKDLSEICNLFEGERTEDSNEKCDAGKDDIHKSCTSPTTFKLTDTAKKETLGESKFTKDPVLSINSEKGDVSERKLNFQEENIQTAVERDRREVSRFYLSNKSKSLDWRGGGTRGGYGSRTEMTSGSRNFYEKSIRRTESLESNEANIRTTSNTEENQPNSVLQRIQSNNTTRQGDQDSGRKDYLVSRSTPVSMKQVTHALERTSSGQSLPVRLKPRLSLGCIGEVSNILTHRQDESSVDQSVSWAREQGLGNSEEVTGNQTITERILKLYGGSLSDPKSDANSKDSLRLKHQYIPNTDRPNSEAMDSIPNLSKSTNDPLSGTPSPTSDSQQSRLSYSQEKAGTFPRRFSKSSFFGQRQEPSTTSESKNDKKDASSGLSISASSTPKWGMEGYAGKMIQSHVPADKEETRRIWFGGSPELCSQSLERTRNRFAATVQSRINITLSDGGSSISSQGAKRLVTTTGGVKEEIGKDKQSNMKGLEISERKNLSGLQDGLSQPKYVLASKGAAHSEIHKEGDDVFTLKTEGRRGEGLLEKMRVPSMDSVKNTINKFEALAQQSQITPQTLRTTRRAFSVPEQPKSVPRVKKSDSDRNLHFRRVVGNTENLSTNLISKSNTSEDTGILDSNRTLKSNSVGQVRATLEQSKEPNKERDELVPTFKQLDEPKTDLYVSKWDENKRKTLHNRHIDEPDFSIPTHSGLKNIGTTDEKTMNPSHQSRISQTSNVNSSFEQQNINVNHLDLNRTKDLSTIKSPGSTDDENDVTPTNSPERPPFTVNTQRQNNSGTPAQPGELKTSESTPEHSDIGVFTPVKSTLITSNGTHPKVQSNLSHSSAIPVQTTLYALNNVNNNCATTRKVSGTFVANMAVWSSEEEFSDDEDDEGTEKEEDSDSGESSVTITSHMSQSDRSSFSLSLADLCNIGGVEYKSSDGSESGDCEDWSSRRSASLSSDISAMSSVTLLSMDELDRLLDDVRSLGDDTLQKYEDVQVVVLHKEVGSGLGFTLAGGVDQNKPVTVHKVIAGGVAALEGSISEGDRVLSINGNALQHSAHWEVLRMLRKARTCSMAVVVLQRGDLSETQHGRKEASHKPGNTGRRVRVILDKSSSDLGFSLEGGLGSTLGDKPLTVQKVFQGGPVNAVFPGDELLELQGQSLVGMRRLDAWNLIRKLPPGPVEVLLHRPYQSQ